MKIKKKLNLSYWFRKIYTSKFYQLIHPNNEVLKKKIFTSIYKSKHWVHSNNISNEIVSVSGPGSNLNKGAFVKINFFKKIIKDLKIKSILDMACGDFLWMNKIIDQANIDYLGIDIVKELINENKSKYKKRKIKFKSYDIVNYSTKKKFDLIIIKDLLIHLKNSDILKIIDNLRNMNFKYLALSSSTIKQNKDVIIGQHRQVNLLKEPYNLKKPKLSFKDGGKNNFVYIFEKKDLE